MKFEPVAVDESRVAFLPWLTLLACSVGLLFVPITHDAIWQMWLGRQMLGGARLYSDIIEVNPPLWFWIAVPLAALRLDPRLTIIGFFVGATALSMYLTPPRYRLILLPALLILPLHDFGQREHFTLIATAPYAFLVGSRADRQEVRHPLLIGLFAAVGFALKPWFVIVPLALEALQPKHVRPETIALAGCAAAYALAIPTLAPAYFSVTLPMVREMYPAFLGAGHYFIAFAAFAIALAGVGGRKGSGTTRALGIAALAFLPAFILQGKGWAYHSVPARGFLFLAICAELMRERRQPFADGLLVGAAVLCFWPFGIYRNDYRAEMERHLVGVAPGTSIIVLASNPSTAWPMVEEHRLAWQLHAFSVWQINSAVARPELVPKIRSSVAPDLAKRPDILILDDRPALGAVAHALVPQGYLSCYSLRLRTPRMESYAKRC